MKFQVMTIGTAASKGYKAAQGYSTELARFSCVINTLTGHCPYMGSKQIAVSLAKRLNT